MGGVHAIRKLQNGRWELLMEIRSGLVVLAHRAGLISLKAAGAQRGQIGGPVGGARS